MAYFESKEKKKEKRGLWLLEDGILSKTLNNEGSLTLTKTEDKKVENVLSKP